MIWIQKTTTKLTSFMFRVGQGFVSIFLENSLQGMYIFITVVVWHLLKVYYRTRWLVSLFYYYYFFSRCVNTNSRAVMHALSTDVTWLKISTLSFCGWAVWSFILCLGFLQLAKTLFRDATTKQQYRRMRFSLSRYSEGALSVVKSFSSLWNY